MPHPVTRATHVLLKRNVALAILVQLKNATLATRVLPKNVTRATHVRLKRKTLANLHLMIVQL